LINSARRAAEVEKREREKEKGGKGSGKDPHGRLHGFEKFLPQCVSVAKLFVCDMLFKKEDIIVFKL
jgi:hypothetical protein